MSASSAPTRFIPPFKPIGPLEIYRREHEERTGHRVQVYCYVCCDFHTTEAVETPLDDRVAAEEPPETPLGTWDPSWRLWRVLKRAGYGTGAT